MSGLSKRSSSFSPTLFPGGLLRFHNLTERSSEPEMALFPWASTALIRDTCPCNILESTRDPLGRMFAIPIVISSEQEMIALFSAKNRILWIIFM
uniref:Uncharacterized protein n=1 Tax=Lepeophtheirus salmonis TaxID=72036 RepID=A0A0K2TMI6_LEPSM